MTLNKSIVEVVAGRAWFQELGYAVLPGPPLSPGDPTTGFDGLREA